MAAETPVIIFMFRDGGTRYYTFWREIKGFPVESVYFSLAGFVLQAYQAYLAFPVLDEEGWGKGEWGIALGNRICNINKL